MTALMGTFVKVSTMADGTPRIVLDMQCSLSDIAAMGLVPGVPFAIARLTNEAAQTPPQEEKPKGGELAKLAGIWCNEASFQKWTGTSDATEAAEFIYRKCKIDSRAELDHNDQAAHIFREYIRGPYMAYMASTRKP
jgi:hypothetical protein